MAYQRLISGKRAWALFLEQEVLDPRTVRTEVASSWQRCRTLHVDPVGIADDYNRKDLLEERLYQKEQLCRVARPFMQDLYYFVRGSQFQVVLTDEKGFLLEVLGDPAIVSRTKQVHLSPGAIWSEAEKGTNAIGTALIEQKPVQINAWEHFRQENHFLTCSASPIRDPAGNIIGVLDVSGDYRCANAHTMGMVVATVRAVENQIRLEQVNRQLYVASRYSATLLHSISEGLIAIDSSGIVTEVNPRGGEIFCVNPLLSKGRHLNQVFGGHTPLLKALSDGKEYEDEEIIIEKLARKIRSSASPLRDETGAIVGAVAVFHEVTNRPIPKRPTVIRTHRHSFADIVGDSPAMKDAKEWAQLAAKGISTVLILGESGTGKEMFANAIHSAGSRGDRPFVAINCAAVPEALIESELFGYADGSFTGARKGGQAGKFEVAAGGTIFLDEIGDMSLNLQSKLLRVLQEKKVSRVGSAMEIPVDIRIIAATHNDLKTQVERGTFREDLYYRVAVLEVRIPPLRERMEDIADLVRYLTAKLAAKLGFDDIRIEDSFIKCLSAHNWPGNVRELENIVERSIVRMNPDRVLRGDLLLLPIDRPCDEPPSVESDPPPPSDSGEVKPLWKVEKEAIAEALTLCQGNIQRTASRLGIGRNTLYRKMEEYGLALPQNPRRFGKSLTSAQ
jgi:sigma-54 dependent transcriptional regulator, acetoin dehydrogenase operon transcriptional activator AcoR